MAVGSCIIDGIDLATLGIFIGRGGSDDFISFPERRAPAQNDWAEHHGLEVDLSDLVFEAKTVKVNYVLVATDETTFKNRLNAFENLHFSPGYRQIYVREFNKTFSLRFVGFSDYKHKGGLLKRQKKVAKIAVEYAMDHPLQLFAATPTVPTATRDTLAQITLNGFDLSRFGIVVRDAYSTALRPRSAKGTLERKSSATHGTIADVGIAPKRQARQIAVECTMLAGTLAEFWTNYTALFNNFRTTSAVQLGITRTGKVLNCYYSKMGNFKKETPFSRKIKISFTLILQEI